MSVELNHIIIPARSKWASATFLACILDVPAGPQRELFVPVKVANGVTVEYVDAEGFDSHHCSFLVGEAEFDAAFARIRSTGITYYAGPHHERPGEINRLRGGRGVYFDDPDGHNIEIMTRPYGDPPAPAAPAPATAAAPAAPADGLTSTEVKVAGSHGD